MKKYLNKISKSAGVLYVSSGLFKTFSVTISGIIILRWLDPIDLGQWQSFLVFVGYLQIFTLGTTSGLNREIAFLIGQDKREEALKKLKTVGYYTTALSLGLMVLILLMGIFFAFFEVFTFEYALMFVLAFSTSSLGIQTSFLGATYRSSSAFVYLGKVQFFTSFLYFLLLPLVYYYDLWGYIIYQVVVALMLYIGYYVFRPYKVKYEFKLVDFKEMVGIGMPMYIWNYLASVSRSIPRLILVAFSGPLMVGLYSPAGSINNAFLALPLYINRYLFPQMSHIYGKTGDKSKVYDFTMSAIWKLFILMSIMATLIALTIPYIVEQYFEKYTMGIIAVQITVFSGVFFCLNTMMHSALNSLKSFKVFRVIITMRFIFILAFSGIGYLLFNSWLNAVSFGALMSEMFNFFNYWRFLYTTSKKIKDI
ncbi:oligosaccharide flippase family protein [uncultured Flavobacterium sp.]|uniref:oligosaccharide flippase family protein n=1 Tax=uncultured Flavobacterium sp. TaxID=165435 RepID=UPI00263466AB|nr:oligosaccharide flippase family protein [uncultured Flavobacterium sp.]